MSNFLCQYLMWDITVLCASYNGSFNDTPVIILPFTSCAGLNTFSISNSYNRYNKVILSPDTHIMPSHSHDLQGWHCATSDTRTSHLSDVLWVSNGQSPQTDKLHSTVQTSGDEVLGVVYFAIHLTSGDTRVPLYFKLHQWTIHITQISSYPGQPPNKNKYEVKIFSSSNLS